MRKNNKLSRVQKMEKFLKDIMKFFNCDMLTIVNGTHWYGEYGRVATLGNNDSLEIHRWENLRKVYKVAHAIWNDTKTNQDDRIFVSYRWNTPSLVLVEGGIDISDGNGLYKLANGQIYDAYDMYWFDISQSKVLKKWLKGGYGYCNPQEFCEDYYKEEDRIWRKQHPDEEE